MKLKALSLLVLSLFVVESSFADYRPRPPRPAPHRPRPVPAPMPRPRPIPQRPRPVPMPIPRPIPRPMPRPVPMPTPSYSRACFYELPHYQGQYFCVNPGGRVHNLSEVNFNNRISSAIIPAGFYVTVYAFEGFYGQSLDLTGGIPDLGMYGWDWDNNISSINYRY